MPDPKQNWHIQEQIGHDLEQNGPILLQNWHDLEEILADLARMRPLN